MTENITPAWSFALPWDGPLWGYPRWNAAPETLPHVMCPMGLARFSNQTVEAGILFFWGTKTWGLRFGEPTVNGKKLCLREIARGWYVSDMAKK